MVLIGEYITSVTDSAGRSVSYGYANGDLTDYTDSGNKLWKYGYNGAHKMTTVFNPLDITTVVNTYDSLGRVNTQAVPRQAGTAGYKFYFSGFRNIELRRNYFFITRGKLRKELLHNSLIAI